MVIKAEWISAPGSRIRHAHVSKSAVTLCCLPVPEDSKPSQAGLRCSACLGFETELGTPAGQLVYEACGTVNVAPTTWTLAEYVTQQCSKLAIDLAEIRKRIDALYMPPAG